MEKREEESCWWERRERDLSESGGTRRVGYEGPSLKEDQEGERGWHPEKSPRAVPGHRNSTQPVCLAAGTPLLPLVGTVSVEGWLTQRWAAEWLRGEKATRLPTPLRSTNEKERNEIRQLDSNMSEAKGFVFVFVFWKQLLCFCIHDKKSFFAILVWERANSWPHLPPLLNMFKTSYSC